MENEIQYYLDDDGGLWKKEGTEHYFFSRKSLDWIKSQIFYILPGWDYNNAITKEAAEKILLYYKAEGKWEDEKIPMRYFANDSFDIFSAIDIFGNEYILLADMTVIPADKGFTGHEWESFDKKEIETYVNKLYQKNEWLMVAEGERLERYIGDYKGIIWLGDYQGGLPKSEIGYRSQVILDDCIDTPCPVAYFEAATIDELKKMTEFRMNRGPVIPE